LGFSAIPRGADRFYVAALKDGAMALLSFLGSPLVRRLLAWLATVPWLGRLINRIATNTIARSTSPRPRPYSLW
jgi:hypothetical protein